MSNKKIYTNTSVIASVITILLIITAISLSQTKIYHEIYQSLDQPIKPLTQKDLDFPNTKGGTFSGIAGTEFPEPPMKEVIVLFASVTVPGLALIYYPQENRLIAGTPQMIAEGIELFQGKKHELTYSFNKNGKQAIFYDGELKVESDFKLYNNDLTGMITGTSEVLISDGFDEIKIS